MIVEVGQEEVNSPPEVAAKVNQAQQDNKKSVLLLIDRQGDLRFVALRFPEQAAVRGGRRPKHWHPKEAVGPRPREAVEGVRQPSSRGTSQGRVRQSRTAAARGHSTLRGEARFSPTTKSLLATP